MSSGRPTLLAGEARANISPLAPTFLYGYPHVPRLSTGVHDPLLASALYLRDGGNQILFVEVDVIWLSRLQVAEVRASIAARTDLTPEQIMVAASHTHSGPVTLAILSNEADEVVPPPDPEIVAGILNGIVDAAERAFLSAEPAEVAMTSGRCDAIGSNRHDPNGPRITEIPIIAVRSSRDSEHWIGLMFVNPVHPTVLHEDSKQISGDFPAICRNYLQRSFLGPNCPVLSCLGAAGNQSPRHVARANTFAEAERLGEVLGVAIADALLEATFQDSLDIAWQTKLVELPPREFGSVADADQALEAARKRLLALRTASAPAAVVRTAECEVFGAEETAALARAARRGATETIQKSCMPAEIQILTLGRTSIVGWPGEVFVEYAIELRERCPDAIVITLANGELQGYLVTSEAVHNGCYEAGNALFASPGSGELLVAATLRLLSSLRGKTLST